MANKTNTIQELNLADSFLFGKVMRDTEICRMVLEKILNVPIKKAEIFSILLIHIQALLIYYPSQSIFTLHIHSSIISFDVPASNLLPSSHTAESEHKMCKLSALEPIPLLFLRARIVGPQYTATGEAKVDGLFQKFFEFFMNPLQAVGYGGFIHAFLCGNAGAGAPVKINF